MKFNIIKCKSVCIKKKNKIDIHCQEKNLETMRENCMKHQVRAQKQSKKRNQKLENK